MTTDRKIEVGLAAISFPLIGIGLAFNSETLFFTGASALVSIGVWEVIKALLRKADFINVSPPEQ